MTRFYQWLLSNKRLLTTATSLTALGPFVVYSLKRDGDKKPILHSHDHKHSSASTAIRRFMTIHGVPGLSVGISVDGKTVYNKGFGMANVESGGKCNENSVMRIASISKAISSVIAGRLMEEGKLDLDKPIKVRRGGGVNDNNVTHTLSGIPPRLALKRSGWSPC